MVSKRQQTTTRSYIRQLPVKKKAAWAAIIVMTPLLILGAILLFKKAGSGSFEITDKLGGNIFPSAIISTATTDAQIVKPSEGLHVGNPKSIIAIRLKSNRKNCNVRIELARTPFYAQSVSEFVLPEAGKEYTVYPDILWDYDALRQNSQAEPISVVAEVEMDGKNLGQKVRTFSVRSINECMIGYVDRLPDGRTRYISTKQLFAAYVNEDNKDIDKLLREALNSRLVRRFQGYQNLTATSVDRQVYALWYVLQKRHFTYSSISTSSMSSNVVYSQRVRTFDDALSASQINCVDGSVLFASLLRAINITPVLVLVPGHMFVGYYKDNKNKELAFIETTMIGDVDLDDYFPEEKLDSLTDRLSQSEASRLAFDKSKEYAMRAFRRHEANIKSGKPGYMMLEISKNVRRQIQPIGL